MLNIDPKNKLAGVLTPLFALRGSADLGVGDTQALHELVDWAAEAGLGVIQILPINETGSDHSPYNILSSVAIEPSTIATTPEFLQDLNPEDFVSTTAKFDLQRLRANEVCYAEVKSLKLELLRAAFDRLSSPTRIQAFKKFAEEHREWLEPYALFRSLVHLHGQSELFEHWPPEERTVSSARKWAADRHNKIAPSLQYLQNFYSYVQWIAFSQWQNLRKYAESRGIALMGDIPLGVSIFSADVWATPHLFDLTRFCGAPPEKVFHPNLFTEKWGQNWGFPLYQWHEMSKDNFRWWRQRLRVLQSIFHFLRIDHALGFFRVYSFPWPPQENERFASLSQEQARTLTEGRLPEFVEHDDSTEENRRKNQIHGETLFRIFLEETGPHRLIAEDLGGEVPAYIRPSLESLEIPGFKIPLWEKSAEGSPLPGTEYQRLSLATYATHDHPPLKMLWERWLKAIKSGDSARKQAAEAQRHDLLQFAELSEVPADQELTEETRLSLLKSLFASNSWLAIPIITDFFGTDQQFNVPGNVSDSNWRTRLKTPVALWITEEKALVSQIQKILKTTCRKIL